MTSKIEKKIAGLKSISVKADPEVVEQLHMIVSNLGAEQKRKVHIREIILEAIEEYLFVRYKDYLVAPVKKKKYNVKI
jgi:hypothetical protein